MECLAQRRGLVSICWMDDSVKKARLRKHGSDVLNCFRIFLAFLWKPDCGSWRKECLDQFIGVMCKALHKTPGDTVWEDWCNKHMMCRGGNSELVPLLRRACRGPHAWPELPWRVSRNLGWRLSLVKGLACIERLCLSNRFN